MLARKQVGEGNAVYRNQFVMLLEIARHFMRELDQERPVWAALASQPGRCRHYLNGVVETAGPRGPLVYLVCALAAVSGQEVLDLILGPCFGRQGSGSGGLDHQPYAVDVLLFLFHAPHACRVTVCPSGWGKPEAPTVPRMIKTKSTLDYLAYVL